MHYKLFKYELLKADGRQFLSDKHFKLFENSKGADGRGRYVKYRGKNDAVLMFLREYSTKFIGLIGKYSEERDVTRYDNTKDEIYTENVDDNDYPHTAFMCFPRIKIVACVDGAAISSLAAMRRLHQILASRASSRFEFEEISQTYDLRKVVEQFKVVKVDFEILPVNPHSEDLGLALDKARMVDHIKRIRGSAEAPKTDPMKLEGGFLTAIQQLQRSGHCKVGFRGFTDGDVEVHVPKPDKARKLSEDDEAYVHGEEVGVRISFPKEKFRYPFDESHVLKVYKVAKQFVELSKDES